MAFNEQPPTTVQEALEVTRAVYYDMEETMHGTRSDGPAAMAINGLAYAVRNLEDAVALINNIGETGNV